MESKSLCCNCVHYIDGRCTKYPNAEAAANCYRMIPYSVGHPDPESFRLFALIKAARKKDDLPEDKD